MGIAGFGYVIDSLHAPDDHPNELNEAVRTMFSFDFGLAQLFQFVIPGLRHIVRSFYHVPPPLSN